VGRLRQAFIVLHRITQGATRPAIWGLSFLTAGSEHCVFLFFTALGAGWNIGSKGVAQRAVSEVKHPTARCFGRQRYLAPKGHF